MLLGVAWSLLRAKHSSVLTLPTLLGLLPSERDRTAAMKASRASLSSTADRTLPSCSAAADVAAAVHSAAASSLEKLRSRRCSRRSQQSGSST